MKIIDLLNKIANRETVLFKYRNITYYYNYDFKEYISTQKYYRQGDIMEHYFLLEEIDMTNLNDEVEIIEEEKGFPEKLEILQFSDLIDMSKEELIETIKEQRFKINKIIDYLKSKGE